MTHEADIETLEGVFVLELGIGDPNGRFENRRKGVAVNLLGGLVEFRSANQMWACVESTGGTYTKSSKRWRMKSP